MKAFEIIDKLFALADERDYSKSCDKCIAGDSNAEVKKVAVTMFPSPKVIKAAKDWGADLFISHEPYFHCDVAEEDIVDVQKRKLIEDSGMTFYRYHDHTHYTTPDIIAAGEFRSLDLKGRMETTDIFDLVRFYPDNPITAKELAKLIEEKLGIKHVRICGASDIPSTVISGVFGAAGKISFAELIKPESQIVLVGEATEWLHCEYARDAAEFGMNKSLLILGHEGSERDGMKYTADILKEMFPDTEIKYFECGEVYTYTD